MLYIYYICASMFLLLFLVNICNALPNETRNMIKRAESGKAADQFALGRAYQYGNYGFKVNYNEAAVWYEKAANQKHSVASVEMARYLASYSLNTDCSKVLYWFNKAFINANAEAYSMIGHIFFYGLGGCIAPDTSKANIFLQESIKKEEYIHAYYLLGYLHLFTRYSAVDTLKGMQYLRKAVQLGNTSAIYNLALLYQYGKYIKQSTENAKALYEVTVKRNHTRSMVRLGEIYAKIDTSVTKDKALYWYSKAAELGDAEAYYRLSLFWQNGIKVEKDSIKAFSLCLEAAKKGYQIAMYHVGNFYQFGYGVEQDLFQAIMWYKKAAQSGDKQASKELGWIFYKNDNEDIRDYKEAQNYFKEAGKLGLSGLATMYLYGDSVKKDLNTAVELFKQSDSIDNGYSACGLGNIYYYEKEFRNDSLALYWYKKSADKKYAIAINNLANMHECGYGVTVNYEKAMEYYIEAANLGVSTADLSLGKMYAEGKGVVTDTSKAFKYFLKSSEKNNSYGIFELGKFLIEKRGKEKNIIQGLKLVQNSAFQKLPEAMYYCSLIYFEGIYVKKDLVESMAWILLSKKFIDGIDIHVRSNEELKITGIYDKVQKYLSKEMMEKAEVRSAEIYNKNMESPN